MTPNRKYFTGVIVLGLLPLFAFVTPARAGVGPSTWCADGAGTETPIISSPITLNLETGTGPDLNICYSTTAVGSNAVAVSGGRLSIGAGSGRVLCEPDTSSTLMQVLCEVDSDTIRVRLTVQGDTYDIGVMYTMLDTLVCLRSATVFTPTGSVGPYDIGVCTP